MAAAEIAIAEAGKGIRIFNRLLMENAIYLPNKCHSCAKRAHCTTSRKLKIILFGIGCKEGRKKSLEIRKSAAMLKDNNH